MTDTAQSMDIVLPFTLAGGAFRGRLVRLHNAAHDTIDRQKLPNVVGELMGEALAMATAVGSNLKFDGVITVQSASDGPVPRIVADMTSDGNVRASVAYVPEKIERLVNWDKPLDLDIGHLMGSGHMALTVDQGEHMERYQGVVQLRGAALSDVAVKYFQQSEQIESEMILAAAPPADGFGWRAGAVLLQRLPAPDCYIEKEAEEEAWETISVLLKSLTEQELLDPTLSAEQLLLRLFHANECRVYEGMDIQFACRCSHERLEGVLQGMPDEDIDHAADDNREIHITCDFCKTNYSFNADQIKDMKANNAE